MSETLCISGLFLTFEVHFKHMTDQKTNSGHVVGADYSPLSYNDTYSQINTETSAALKLPETAPRTLSFAKSLLHIQAHFCSTLLAFIVLLSLFEGQKYEYIFNIPAAT